jgi:hypothetical protein
VGDKLKEEPKLPAHLSDYADVFEPQAFDKLPPHREWDHAIELIEGVNEKLDCKIYTFSHNEQVELDKFLEENLRTGRI